MALYRHTSGFVCEYASNPGAGYTAIAAQPTDTLANKVKWWRDIDKGATGIINSGTITAAGSAVTTAILSAGGATDGMYVGMTIAITSGGSVTTVKITAYNGSTKTATFASAMTWVAGSAYSITSSWHPSEYRTPQDPAEAVLSMSFSKDAAFFSADHTGLVTDAYLGGSCTVRVTRGGSDVTDAEGWTLTKVDDGCTSTLTKSGGIWTLTITNVALLATKSGYVRVTATRTGSTTQVRDWNWMKVQNGSNGTNGTNGARGSRQILVTTADGVWSDLTAWNGIVTQTGTTPVLSDLVTIAKTDGTVATSKFCTGNSASPGVWTMPNAYINGSLLVTGTVGANQIAAGSITTSKLAVGSGGNIVSNSGPVLGAETVDWTLGYYNTTTATGPTAGGAAERPAGGASIKVTATGAAVDKIFGLQSLDNFPVMPGVKYEFSAYLAGTNTKLLAMKLIWCDANGNQLSVDGSGNPVYEQAGSGGNAAISTNIATWYRSTGITTPAPDNARQAFIIMRGTCASTSNPTMVASQIFVAQAGPNQTEISPWSPSGVATLIDGTGIKAGSITADRLVAGTITAASAVIANAAIETATIKDAAITTAKIGDLAVTAAKIADATITAAKIANATITDAKIANATITSAKIVSLSADKISAGTINAAVINVTNLRADEITVGTLVTEQIGSGAITAAGGVAGSGTTVAVNADYAFFTFSLPAVSYGRGNIAINWQILVSIDTATALKGEVRIYRAVGGGGYVVSRTYSIGYNYTNIGYDQKHLFTGVYFDSSKNSGALDYKIEVTNVSAASFSVVGRDAWYVEMKR